MVAAAPRFSPSRLTPSLGVGLWILITLALPGAHGALPTQADPAEGFRLALPGYSYAFPRDHGSHDEFRTEWWYYTGHLTSEDGRRFGYQLTFFRRGIAQTDRPPNPSRWAIRHLYLAHFAVTDVNGGRFVYDEKVSRAALGKAGAATGRLHTWIDRWAATADGRMHHLTASTSLVSIDLRLATKKRPVLHGDAGISRKGQERGEASHYYSLTRMETEGILVINNERFSVKGGSWMDHEFGSMDLGEDLVGWDWFSIQLTDQTELMFYRLRHPDGRAASASSGTFIDADGDTLHLTTEDLHLEAINHWVSERSGARYPSQWRIAVPRLGLVLSLTPLIADQELITGKSTQITYWEGAVHVTGTRAGAAVEGEGYVELTGYAEPFDTDL